MRTPPAGWLPDPATARQLRWWNGQHWSTRTRPAPAGAPGVPDVPTEAFPVGSPPLPGAGGGAAPLPRPEPAASPTGAGTRLSYLPAMLVSLVASVGVMIGSVGPWASFLTLSTHGIEGDGAVTLVLGALAASALISIVRGGRATGFGRRWASPVIGALCLIIAVLDLSEVASFGTEFFGYRLGLQIGWGLWLMTISSLVLLVAGVSAATKTRKK